MKKNRLEEAKEHNDVCAIKIFVRLTQLMMPTNFKLQIMVIIKKYVQVMYDSYNKKLLSM